MCRCARKSEGNHIVHEARLTIFETTWHFRQTNEGKLTIYYFFPINSEFFLTAPLEREKSARKNESRFISSEYFLTVSPEQKIGSRLRGTEQAQAVRNRTGKLL